MPKLVQWIFPKRVWTFSSKKNAVYLTFDDGPIPHVTPWVLDILKQHQAKATFFCIGDNIKKHPKVFTQLITEGHSVGNHTFNHLNGWETTTEDYIVNCERFEEILKKSLDKSAIVNQQSPTSNLFRPPYGKITSKQAKAIQKKGYNIIMWDVLSADFDTTISKERCLQNVLKNIKAGSIIVFHDSLKAEEKLRYTLPKVLAFISKKGWICDKISGFN